MTTFRYVSSAGELVFDQAHGYILKKPDGIDTVQVSVSQSQGIGQVGSTVQSRNVQPRPVTINGTLVGSNQAACKAALMATVLPDDSARLYCDDYYLDVVVTATPVVGALRHNAEFQFALLAAYPYWTHSESETAKLTGINKLFRFPWALREPYRFGERVKNQFIILKNDGHVEVPYRVQFTALGPVVNPRLIEASTNNYLAINKTMQPGERLEVKITHDKTFATSSIDGDVRGAIALGSRFFSLKAGDNVIKPDADSGKDDLQVEIDFASELVGVVL